ncbi:hypothetical protein HBA54_20860 [Pelagibius litoralis]|uniref:Uncharacterized protein n=1 Tax=Pelagibius litoralis TaxID=374515 RepID=A0A967KCU1_9PROT|nr:hypothetical protein [Pelagibius litoralis]NIA71054.1 hypothetical protein [Pelagibius litoralis]
MTADAAYDPDASLMASGVSSLRSFSLRQNLTEEDVIQAPRSGSISSYFAAKQTNKCLFSIARKLQELAGLPVGWDGYDGQPLQSDIANFAFKLLSETLDPDCPPPQIVPLGYGGLQLEWHERGIDLEIEIEAPNRVALYFCDHQTGEEIEQQISTDYTAMAEQLAKLSSRIQT